MKHMFKFAIHYTGLQVTGINALDILGKAAILDNNPHHWKFVNEAFW